jgi:uncharacterized damage-inducible protein DinB
MDTLQLLDTERAALLANVARVAEQDRSRRPAPDRWSVAEVLEHLATVERGIAKLLTVRGRETPSPDSLPATPLDADRIAALRGRDKRLEAPERVKPSGSVNAADALSALETARASLRKALVDADPASLDGCTHTHPVLGTLTLRDWVHFVAHHEARHAAQVAEIAEQIHREIGEVGEKRSGKNG